MKRGIQALVFLSLCSTSASAATLDEYATEESKIVASTPTDFTAFEPSSEPATPAQPVKPAEVKAPPVLGPECTAEKMAAASACGLPFFADKNKKGCREAILKMWDVCPWERICLKEEDKDPYSAIFELIKLLCKNDNSTDSTTTCGQLRHLELACAGLTSDLPPTTSGVQELTKKQAAAK